jgi:hypothetical protein
MGRRQLAKCGRLPVVALSLTLGVWHVGCGGRVQSSTVPLVSSSAEHHLHLPGAEILRIMTRQSVPKAGYRTTLPRFSSPQLRM